jgi:hypothetical protein
MSPSRVLRECDPTAHRCGVNDYADSQRDQWTEVEGEYYETREVDKVRESFIEDLQGELSNLEIELEEAEEDQKLNEDETEKLAFESKVQAAKNAVEAKQAQIEECENHSF